MSQQMPVNQARRVEDYRNAVVVIDECTVCGQEHRHGAVGFEEAGDSDTRAPHCHTPDEPTSYKIVLEGQQ